MPVLDAE